MTHLQPWHALIVKPRHEKTVAQCLRYKHIDGYVPLLTVRRRWSDRIKSMELPLFPGYVFCQCDYDSRLAVLNTPGVNSFVSFGNGPAMIAADEIASVRAIVDSGCTPHPGPFMRAGDRVRIVDGPLSGVTGILLREKDSVRVVVNIELLRRSVSVEIDREMVYAVERCPVTAPVPMRFAAYAQAAPILRCAGTDPSVS